VWDACARRSLEQRWRRQRRGDGAFDAAGRAGLSEQFVCRCYVPHIGRALTARAYA